MVSVSDAPRYRCPWAASSAVEIRVVVDLAVEHDPDAAVLVGHRLAASGEKIHDGQPHMPQADGAAGPEPSSSGPRGPHGPRSVAAQQGRRQPVWPGLDKISPLIPHMLTYLSPPPRLMK